MRVAAFLKILVGRSGLIGLEELARIVSSATCIASRSLFALLRSWPSVGTRVLSVRLDSYAGKSCCLPGSFVIDYVKLGPETRRDRA